MVEVCAWILRRFRTLGSRISGFGEPGVSVLRSLSCPVKLGLKIIACRSGLSCCPTGSLPPGASAQTGFLSDPATITNSPEALRKAQANAGRGRILPGFFLVLRPIGAMADPAALLGAAVRAAVLAKAPRRTVQAVAATVTAVLTRQDTAVARPETVPTVTARVPGPPCACETQVLIDQLREARRAKRQRKRARRREKAMAAAPPATPMDVETITDEAANSTTADGTITAGHASWAESFQHTGYLVDSGGKMVKVSDLRCNIAASEKRMMDDTVAAEHGMQEAPSGRGSSMRSVGAVVSAGSPRRDAGPMGKGKVQAGLSQPG